MAGGNWDITNRPVLPGFYINFETAAGLSMKSGARGIVAIPVTASWGPIKQFVTIQSDSDINNAYTMSSANSETAYRLIHLALLGGASQVLAYRLASSSAAKESVTLMDANATPAAALILTTKYETARSFYVTVTPVVGATPAKTSIDLFEVVSGNTTHLGSWQFASDSDGTNSPVKIAMNAINNDTSNQWITASLYSGYAGTDKLATVSDASKVFSGGNNGISGIAALDYTNFLSAAEGQIFNMLCLDSTITNEDSLESIQDSYVSWVKTQRINGKEVMCVLGNIASNDTSSSAPDLMAARAQSMNSEGVVYVGTGATLAGVSYSSSEIAVYVAGLIAGQKLSESITYAVTPFDDVTRRWNRLEQTRSVNSGVLILINNGKGVKVLRGINTLTSLGSGESNAWKKIRTIRVMDSINDDLQTTAEDNFIGKINNNDSGRKALLYACGRYLQTLQIGGVIDGDWSVILDPNWYGGTLTPEADQVYLLWSAKLTDCVEQIFSTFMVE